MAEALAQAQAAGWNVTVNGSLVGGSFTPGVLSGYLGWNIDPLTGTSCPADTSADELWSCTMPAGASVGIQTVYISWGPEYYKVEQDLAAAIGQPSGVPTPTSPPVSRTITFSKRATGTSGAWTVVGTYTFSSDSLPASPAGATYAVAVGASSPAAAASANAAWPYVAIDVSGWGVANTDDLKMEMTQAAGPRINYMKRAVYWDRINGMGQNYGAAALGNNDQSIPGVGSCVVPSQPGSPAAWSAQSGGAFSEWVSLDAMGSKSWIYGPLYRRQYLNPTASGYGIAMMGASGYASGYWYGPLNTRCRLTGIVADAANTWKLFIEYQHSPAYITDGTHGPLPGPTEALATAKYSGVYVVSVGRNGFMSVDFAAGVAVPSGDSYGTEGPNITGPPSQMPVQSHLLAISAMPDSQLMRLPNLNSVNANNLTGTVDPRAPGWEFIGTATELRVLIAKIVDNFDTQTDFKDTIPRTADQWFDNGGSSGTGDGGDGGDGGSDPSYTPPSAFSYDIEIPPLGTRAKQAFNKEGYTWMPADLGGSDQNVIYDFWMPGALGGVMPTFHVNAFAPFTAWTDAGLNPADWTAMWEATRIAFRTIILTFCVIAPVLTNIVAEINRFI